MEDSVVKDQELSKLVSFYEDYEISTIESRAEAERDRDYKDNKQWTDEEIAVLKKRKQPVIVINRIKPKIDFLLGMERQTRTDPRAYPRTPQHEDAAEAATDAIRYVCDNQDFDRLASEAFDNLLVEGICAGEVYIEQKRGRMEIGLGHYHWDRIFYDIHSRARDFSDAKYKGAVIWMDKEDALTRWPGKKDLIEGALTNNNTYDDTMEDAPRVNWVDKDRSRVKICYIYFLDKGRWKYSYFTKDGFLVEPEDSPYIDEDGEPECGLEFESAYVDRDGNRYGVVRQLIGPQDEINKRRSKLLHLVNTRQTYGNKTTGIDPAKVKKELHKPDGHVELEHGEFGRDFGVIPTTDMTTGQYQLLQESKQEIDAIGANAALAGKEERNMSGRALLARQQSGSMELGPVFDAHQAWKRRIYRQIWNRIKQYWTEERWIRVTDDTDNLKFVGLNRPISGKEKIESYNETVPQEQQIVIPPEFANDPRLSAPVEIENHVAEMDVDIIIKESPDTVTIQGEQFEQLVQMYQANPNGIPWEMVVEMSSLRDKDRVLGKQELSPEEQQARQKQEQMAEAHMQLEMGEKQATIQEKQASAMEKQSKAEKNKADALKVMYEPQDIAQI